MAVERVGRDDEVAALRAFFDAAGGGPRALVLEGEPGIGKTTLWSAGVELARERSLRVLSAWPAEAERGLAFSVLGDLFADVPAELLDELPAPRRRALEVALLVEEAGPEQVDPLAVRVGALTLLQRLAREQTVVVAVDDMQWIDAASAAVLDFALRRLEAENVLVFLARRSGEDGALRPPSAERLAVQPLSVGALHRLLVARLGRPFSRHTLLRLHATSGGNPFYALELARLLTAGPEPPDPTRPLPVPGTLHELVGHRLAELPDETQTVLLAASSMADPTIAGLGRVVPDPAHSLEPAVRSGVVELTASDTVRFTHPLLASVLYADVGDDRRRDMHALLATNVDDPVERARHVSLAADGPDEAIAQQLEEAALQAGARGAAAVAADLAEQAARLTPATASALRDHRLLAAARACISAGDAPRAERLVVDMLADVRAGGRRAEALWLLHEVRNRGGDTPEAVRLLREALPQAIDNPGLEAKIQADLAIDVRLTDGLETAERHALRGVELADQVGDPALRAETRSALALIRFNATDPGALALAEEAYGLASSPADELTALWGLIHILVWTDRFDRARALLEAALEEARDRDERLVSDASWYLAHLELHVGRWSRAADYATTALDIEVQYSPDGRPPASTLIPGAMIAAHQGRLEDARATALAGLDLAVDQPAFLMQFHGILGWVELWQGEAAAAAERFRAAEAFGRAAELLEPSFFDWRADEIECLAQLGSLDQAVELLDDWEATAIRVGRERVVARTTRCRGVLASARGEVELALELLEDAAERSATAGDPFARARSLLSLGAARRRLRQKRPAREAIEAALRGFEELGAASWAEQARGELGRIGGRTHAEGLTPAELRVATLVAEGRTNKEVAAALFLGERTVETHLTHIYAKLGVRSRAQLARTLR